jgi:hypothetical protein
MMTYGEVPLYEAVSLSGFLLALTLDEVTKSLKEGTPALFGE